MTAIDFLEDEDDDEDESRAKKSPVTTSIVVTGLGMPGFSRLPS